MDDNLAFRLACTMYAHNDELLKVSPVAREMTLANIGKLPAVPLHPGTELWLKDPGADCGEIR